MKLVWTPRTQHAHLSVEFYSTIYIVTWSTGIAELQAKLRTMT